MGIKHIILSGNQICPEPYQHGTVIIGNFDGIHNGHGAVIRLKDTLPRPHVMLSFTPHPFHYFNPNTPSTQLSSIAQKLTWLEAYNIDALIELEFNEALATTSAGDFAQKILKDIFKASAVITGDDFHFGKGRVGDCEMLKKYDAQGLFTYRNADAQIDRQGMRFSSTAVRDALKLGDMKRAHSILGRAYQICGTVIEGEKIGRNLGFPTANIDIAPYFPPLYGVYAITAALSGTSADANTGADGQTYQGVANFGIRPVLGNKDPLLECYLFDFDSDIYGKQLTVNFWHCLRAEQNFATLELLKQQISKDVEQAKEFFTHDFTEAHND